MEDEKLAKKMAKRLNPPPPSGRVAGLPAAEAVFDGDELAVAMDSLINAQQLQEQIDELTGRLEEAKDTIIALTEGRNVAGYRCGNQAVSITMQSRSSLSRELLLDNGVDPDVIAASEKQGKSFRVVRIVKI